MHLAYVLALACGALAGESCRVSRVSRLVPCALVHHTRRRPYALNARTDAPAPTRRYPTQLRLTLPAPDAPLIGASSPSSSSSSLSISSLLSAAADAAQSLAPSWLPYSSSPASASGNEEELEWSVVDDTPSDDDDSDDGDDSDLLDNTEDDEALLDAWLAEVAEWEDTHQPCIEACRVRVVPGAQDAEEALCSAVGLASARELSERAGRAGATRQCAVRSVIVSSIRQAALSNTFQAVPRDPDPR